MDEKICQERMSTSPIRDGCEERFKTLFRKEDDANKKPTDKCLPAPEDLGLEVMDANTEYYRME